jgi:NAD-dependent deacetylase
MTIETAAQSLADAIVAEPGLILVLTGAGVSAASGIPTFRGLDADAIWKKDVQQLGTYAYFSMDPVGQWQWYRQRLATALGAKPNPAHTSLVSLEHWHVGRGGGFLLVTQNIDTLHEDAGTVNLAKVHGSADRARCSREQCPLSRGQAVDVAALDFTAFEREPLRKTLPCCPACGALMRPHVLWFDEDYSSHPDYQLSRVMNACDALALVVVVGTSFSVGITDFIQTAAMRCGASVFIVDPAEPPTKMNPRAQHIRATAEHFLPLCIGLAERTGTRGGGR